MKILQQNSINLAKLLLSPLQYFFVHDILLFYAPNCDYFMGFLSDEDIGHNRRSEVPDLTYAENKFEAFR